MVQGLLLPECSFTAPRYAVHGVPQTTQRPRGRSRSRQAVRSAASPEKQGQNVPQNSREAPTSSGFPARSLSPTKRSAESRNVAVSATSSAQAQVREAQSGHIKSGGFVQPAALLPLNIRLLHQTLCPWCR